MQAYGSDRVRPSGEKLILHCPISKGWTPRSAPRWTSRQHPGTTVRWEGELFEVLAAEPALNGGMRYTLARWREEDAIRVVEDYDEESEARRKLEHEAALRREKHRFRATMFAFVLGHLPAPIQNRIAGELGISAPRMTLISTIPSVVLLGVCVWLYVGPLLRGAASPVPLWLWQVAMISMLDSGVRYFVYMSQSRAMGSFPGTLIYTLLWRWMPERFPSPFAERGRSVRYTEAPDDVRVRESVELRGPLFSLLAATDQRRLAQSFGYDYRKYAPQLAWIVLFFSAAGAWSSYSKASETGKASLVVSSLIAALLAVEQVARLVALRRGPAGSILGFLVRPFLGSWLKPR